MNNNYKYNWKRFWIPSENQDSVNLSDEGFLYDPDSEYGKYYNPNAVSFSKISEFPCLILLGEPGIGKSSTIKEESNLEEIRIKEKGDYLLKLDLNSFSDINYFKKELFENETFLKWKSSDKKLYLFLDSFDECLLRTDAFSKLLINEFKKLPVERIFFRIISRTSLWSSSLEKDLSTVWENQIKVYELCPLRKRDFISAVASRNIDYRNFLEQLKKVDSIPFAIKPVTLNFLINSFIEQGTVPYSQNDIYYSGCRFLCEEPNDSRRESDISDDYNLDQKLMLASRFAVISIFSNKNIFWKGRELDKTYNSISFQDLNGYSELAQEQDFSISEKAIKETFSTGLFKTYGMNQLVWSHRSYQEYLAAYYISQHNLSLNVLKSLIIHEDGKFIPQLRGVIAWLGGMDIKVFELILQIEPDILLQSDLRVINSEQKKFLVRNFLNLFEDGKSTYYISKYYKHLSKLNYHEISSTLLPYISKQNLNKESRLAAIDICETCNVSLLQDELISIALDASETDDIKEQCISALKNCGDEPTKMKLKELLTCISNNPEMDPVDNMKGKILSVLWSDLISSEELFNNLSFPKTDAYFGSYEYFIMYELVKGLKQEDYPNALNWILKNNLWHSHSIGFFHNQIEKILYNSWEYIYIPEVLKPFAQIIQKRLSEYPGVLSTEYTDFKDRVRQDTYKRQLLITEIVKFMSYDENVVYYFRYEDQIIFDEDFDWLYKQFENSLNNVEKSKWVKLIHLAFDINNKDKVCKILDNCNNEFIKKEFEHYITPIDINSDLAKQRRKVYYRRLEINAKKEKKKKLLNPSPEIGIKESLDKFESGDLEAWWKLNLELTLKPDDTDPPKALEVSSDMKKYPGWVASDDITKERIINAAKVYVLGQKIDCKDVIDKKSIFRPSFSGYRALKLLINDEPEFINNLSQDVWKNWIPSILTFPYSDHYETNSARYKLLNLAYKASKDEFINTVGIIFDYENKNKKDISITNLIEYCWDNDIANFLLDKIKNFNLEEKSFKEVFEKLIKFNFEKAFNYADLFLKDNQECEKAIIIAKELFSHGGKRGYKILKPFFESNQSFFRITLLAIAENNDRIRILNQLTEEEIADLYIMMVKTFPYEKEPDYRMSMRVTPYDVISKMKGYVLNYLKEKGTNKAYNEIKRIQKTFPELNWLQDIINEVEETIRQNTWVPLEPKMILDIFKNNKKRLIQNGNDLINVIVESLEELEIRLHGETPSVVDIWNEVKKGIYRPKDENRLSDYIKRHLENDLKSKGIIINREVEIRRGVVKGEGQRTDIRVDTFSINKRGDAENLISVIIEVKGCWNKELETAMQTQLSERYLKNNPCRHGIYLIGWFNCIAWDKEDNRKKSSPTYTIEEAKNIFNNQAEILNSNDTIHIVPFVLNTAL